MIQIVVIYDLQFVENIVDQIFKVEFKQEVLMINKKIVLVLVLFLIFFLMVCIQKVSDLKKDNWDKY